MPGTTWLPKELAAEEMEIAEWAFSEEREYPPLYALIREVARLRRVLGEAETIVIMAPGSDGRASWPRGESLPATSAISPGTPHCRTPDRPIPDRPPWDH